MNKITKSSFINKHIRENILIYFFITLFFAIGLSVGAFMSKGLDLSHKQNILIFMNNFFQVLGNEPVDFKAIFIKSIKNNMQIIVILWFLAITYIGVPFVFLVDAFKGFVLGFTISFCFQALSVRGLLFILVAIIPQNIIYIPCIFMASAVAVQNGLSTFKKNNIKSGLNRNHHAYLDIAILFFILLLVMTIGSLYESLFVPFVLKKLLYLFIVQ